MVNQLRLIATAHLAHIVPPVWEQSMYCWIMLQVRFFFLFFIARRCTITCIAVIIVNDTSVIIVSDTSFLYT
jgi:hypothetical protein